MTELVALEKARSAAKMILEVLGQAAVASNPERRVMQDVEYQRAKCRYEIAEDQYQAAVRRQAAMDE